MSGSMYLARVEGCSAPWVEVPAEQVMLKWRRDEWRQEIMGEYHEGGSTFWKGRM